MVKEVPVVEVAKRTPFEIPATVVVVLKFGAVFVTVIFPVAPLTVMPAPADKDCGIGV